ncbi:hypothetical protein [Pseudomonas sp. OTU5201]|uniref:hypothetical protein n=1 Tax=Pseudomonas sp. OTU5201 TaxID=3043850 RepID=UPI00313A8D33
MKTRKKLYLALVICGFGAAYTAMIMRPLPPTLAATQYCPPAYPSCFMPVPTIGTMLP